MLSRTQREQVRSLALSHRAEIKDLANALFSEVMNLIDDLTIIDSKPRHREEEAFEEDFEAEDVVAELNTKDLKFIRDIEKLYQQAEKLKRDEYIGITAKKLKGPLEDPKYAYQNNPGGPYHWKIIRPSGKIWCLPGNGTSWNKTSTIVSVVGHIAANKLKDEIAWIKANRPRKWSLNV